jgi:hypothetical protein
MPSARTNRLTAILPMQFTWLFVGFDIAFFVLSYWTGEPLGVLPLAAPFVALGVLLSVIAAAGLAKLLRPLAIPAGPLAVGVAAVGGMTAVALVLPASNGFVFAGPGRYAYMALPAAAALFALGIYAALAMAFARRTLVGLYAVAAIGILAAGAFWPQEGLTPGSGTPPAAASLVDATGRGELRGVTITVDRIAFDPAQSATWFKVTITNSGPGEVEWSPAPIASAGAVTGRGDYMRSTHMPGDVDAAQSATGWLLVHVDPASVRSDGSVRLRFPDVALDGYAVVEDVVVDVKFHA